MNYIKPVTFSVTYGLSEIEDYVEECLEEGKFPTQAGFTIYADRCFDAMLENFPRGQFFDTKLDNLNHNVDEIVSKLTK